MNNFFKSKLFLTLEHAAMVAAFLAVSVFFSELVNHNVAVLVTKYLPDFVTVGMVNTFFAAAAKYFKLKKSEAMVELEHDEPLAIAPGNQGAVSQKTFTDAPLP